MATFDGKPTAKPVVVAWFTAETFKRFQEIYADPAELPDTFEQWLRDAERKLQIASAAGIEPDKVVLDPEAVLAWARSNGIDINNQTRRRYTELFIKPQRKN